MQFSNPKSLEEAYQILSDRAQKIIAGGTDFYPALGSSPVDFDVLDISQISSMRQVKKDQVGDLHIGALVTWTDIIDADLPDAFDGLKLAAREVGSVQIQNRATIVGNICNASPAADGVPPLLTLGAVVKIGSETGERELPLDSFILDNRRTALEPNELVIGLRIPSSNLASKSDFIKIGARRYLIISIAMIAIRIAVNSDNQISDIAISIGSCSKVAARLYGLEKALIGQNISDDLQPIVSDEHFSELSPIDDVRATKEYRIEACRELVLRILEKMRGEFKNAN